MWIIFKYIFKFLFFCICWAISVIMVFKTISWKDWWEETEYGDSYEGY